MEGQRLEKKSGGEKRRWIIPAAVAGVLLVGYLGLCAWVNGSDQIMPNVSVAGLDVSGMTIDQAQRAVEQAVEQYSAGTGVTLHYGEWSGTLFCAELQTHGAANGHTAWRAGREHFLTQGGQYLYHLFGGSSRVPLELGAVAQEQPALDRLLEQANLQVGIDKARASYRVEGDRLVMTKGVTGATFDRERLLFLVADSVEQALEESVAGQRAASGDIYLTEENAVTETAPREPEFEAIRQELYVAVKEPELDPETMEISDHAVGVDFDADALKAAYDRAAEGETISVPLIITQPKDTKESYAAKLFRDVLGEGTTNVSGTANRKNNVKLSAQACNGVILMPGEVFSYNNTTGSRSADKGYTAAPAYVGGASVDQVGGGICQTSSTIYYAVLHTDLEVVERKNHMYNTSYVTEGMDATVYFGSIDFRFQNSTDYPIKIVTESYDKDGKRKLNVKIYGTNETGVYAVPHSTVFDEVTPTTKYVADESVARGTLVLDKKQNAYTGKSARTYRYVYDKDGALLEKQDMGLSKYKMRPHLYYYNPADGDPSTWENGTPPKYVDPGTTTPVDPGVTPDEAGVTPTGPDDVPAPEQTSGPDAPDQAAEGEPQL